MLEFDTEPWLDHWDIKDSNVMDGQFITGVMNAASRLKDRYPGDITKAAG